MNVYTDDHTEYEAQRIFCIGLNYFDHVQEFPGDKPEPVIFMKPVTSIVPENSPVAAVFHGETVHYETELTVLIGKEGIPADAADAVSYIAGLGIGLDLTLRETQSRIRPMRSPWEISKSFDGAAPCSVFHRFDPAIDNLDALEFAGNVGGTLRQLGETKKMISPIPELLLYISGYWKLRKGDIIYTGTPSGVGPLKKGDVIELRDHRKQIHTWIAE